MEDKEPTIDSTTGEVLAEVHLSRWSPIVPGLTTKEELLGRSHWAKAISNCYTDVGNVKKDGYNAFYKYSYPTGDAIFSACKAALAKNGLAVVPLMGKIEDTPITNAQGKPEMYTRVHYEFAVIESETGYTVVVPWVSDAIDNLDKGINKTLTAALKSFLRILFCISDGVDPDAVEPGKEPENGTERPKAKRGEPKAEPAPAPAQPKPERSPEQKKADELLKVALPGLTSENEREKEEAKYRLDALKEDAKSAGLVLSEAVLLICEGVEKPTSANIVQGSKNISDAHFLREDVRKAGGELPLFMDAYNAVLEGYTTSAAFAEYLETKKSA